jgi:dTDP-4-dehydrorhamnose 3,5-epimerase
MAPLNSRISTRVDGLLIIQPQVFYDFRGEFVETYNNEDYTFRDLEGHPIGFVEDDISVSRLGVLRGLHGSEQVWKLVQCLSGEVYCAVADLRPNSPTRFAWDAHLLSERNRTQLLIPAGCATGTLCMTERCVFSYKQSRRYAGAGKQFTIRWDEPKLHIDWPLANPILSERDQHAPLLA